MFSQDSQLIAAGQGGCVGCPCALRWNGLHSRQMPDELNPEGGCVARQQNANRRLVRAALLFLGLPLLLLLCSAAGAVAFADGQPFWALAGAASLLCFVAGGALDRRFRLSVGRAGS